LILGNDGLNIKPLHRSTENKLMRMIMPKIVESPMYRPTGIGEIELMGSLRHDAYRYDSEED
jgi:hypothetical protein